MSKKEVCSQITTSVQRGGFVGISSHSSEQCNAELSTDLVLWLGGEVLSFTIDYRKGRPVKGMIPV